MDLFVFFKQLGGQHAVARAVGLRPQAVNYWVRVNRVPPQHVVTICRFAKKLGIDVQPGALRPDIFHAY